MRREFESGRKPGGERGSGVRSALILAAGLGTRLAGEHSHSPKGFLTLGEKGIVEESVDKLVAAGIERVIIVTGHLAEYYEKFAATRPELIETVYNPDYADSGSMYSFYCARHLLDADFLLLESDLVYEKRALDVLLGGRARDAVLLSGPTQAGDEVYVQAPVGPLQKMSKDSQRLDCITGELVGISRISLALAERMCEQAARVFEDTLHVAYDTESLSRAGEEMEIHCPLVPDLLWGEIDFDKHLTRVREQVYPAIERKDG